MTRVVPGVGKPDDWRAPHTLETSAPVAEPALTARRPIALRRRAARLEDWSRRYIIQVAVVDAVAATLAVLIGWIARVGFERTGAGMAYVVVSTVLTAGWLLCVHGAGGYEARRVTVGTREYQRVLRASVNMAGAVAIIGYASGLLLARTLVAIVIPSGAVLMLLGRWVGRKMIYRQRARGLWTSTILAVGTTEAVRHLAEVTGRNPATGLVVVGACVQDTEIGQEVRAGVPVVGDTRQVAIMAEALSVDIVAVAGSGLGPSRIRELGWALEGTGRSMVMAPGLTEVAGPRVHVSPVEGLPLMWVDQPQFTGLRRVIKRALDIVGASAILILCSPLLALIALAVKLGSRGPVFYRSTRMGQGKKEFCPVKFRSMYADADVRRAELVSLNEVAGGTLFKIRKDPRVTPVGRILRKYSLDELPQLLNVLAGTMSLVGPRPPLPDEVDKYQDHVHRRLLVKPGLTGLWQVSGRSDLSWDESVRLDLYYVENWSLALDLAIIARTVWAVLRARGAY